MLRLSTYSCVGLPRAVAFASTSLNGNQPVMLAEFAFDQPSRLVTVEVTLEFPILTVLKPVLMILLRDALAEARPRTKGAADTVSLFVFTTTKGWTAATYLHNQFD